MAEAINRKIAALQQDTHKSWYSWREGRLFTRRNVLLAPPEYLPVGLLDPAENKKRKLQAKKQNMKMKKWEKKQALAGPSSEAYADEDVEMEE